MIIWANDLSGSTNQNTSGLLADNEFELLVNVTQEQAGNIAHRLGTTRYLNSVSASNQVRGLHSYNKSNGNNYLHMVSGGSLYVNGVSTWTSQDASEWSTSSDIDMVNFTDRHYMASSVAGERLKYATETGAVTTATVWSATASTSSTSSTLVTTTNVFSQYMVGHTIYNITDGTSTTITGYSDPTTVTTGTAINDTWDNDALVIYIDPKYLAVNGGYMIAAGAPLFSRRTYYSDLDIDTFKLSTNFWITSYPPTGVASFGNGRTFVIFTQKGYMSVDPSDPIFTREVEGDFGCVSHKSIVAIGGGLMYLGRDRFNWLSGDSSFPTDISMKIRNDLTANALMNKIDKGLLSVAAAGKRNNIYYCFVRDLSANVKGQDLDSAAFVIDLSQNNWKVETYTGNDLASVTAEFIDATGDISLYGGSFSNGTVHKIATASIYTDDDKDDVTTVVTSVVRTKHYEFVNKTTGASRAVLTKKLWFKYKSSVSITVKYALDGSTTYTTLATLPAYTTTEWDYRYIDLNAESRTISLQLEFSGEAIIYAFGFDAELQKGEGINGL